MSRYLTTTKRRGKGRPKGSTTKHRLVRAKDLPGLPPHCPSAQVALQLISNRSFPLQADLAKQMGFTRQHISNVLLGKSSPSLTFVWEFHRATKVKLDALFPLFIRVYEQASDVRLAMSLPERMKKRESKEEDVCPVMYAG